MPWTWQKNRIKLIFLFRSSLQLTFVGHLRTRLQVHFAASLGSDLVDLVAQVVATVLSAAQAEPFLKGLFRTAPIGFTGIFFVQQRVDEEMNGALMRALHELVHISGKKTQRRRQLWKFTMRVSSFGSKRLGQMTFYAAIIKGSGVFMSKFHRSCLLWLQVQYSM